MDISHKPNVGMMVGGKLLRWGMSRQEVRDLLGVPSKEINLVHNISKYLPGAEDIIERKDSYQHYLGQAVSFATIYDKDDIFKEFELHEADQIIIGDVTISFKAAVPELVDELKKRGYELIELDGSDEDILITSLFTNFASSQHLGGDGNLVSYAYCAENIDHLLGKKG